MSRPCAQSSFAKLKQIRTDLRMTVSELATKSDVSRATATKADAGKAVEPITALKLIEALAQEAAVQMRPENSELIQTINHIKNEAVMLAAPKSSSNAPKEVLAVFMSDFRRYFESGHHQYLSKSELIGLKRALEREIHSIDRIVRGLNKLDG
ncbi:MAG: hypothetical protein ABJF50_22520 [Paracoccaceae bacterium]